jgi:uncharacterized protein (TIGR02466 family)
MQGQILNYFPSQIYKTSDPSFVPIAREMFDTTDWSKYTLDNYVKGGKTTYFGDGPGLPEVAGRDKFIQFIETSVLMLAGNQGVNLSKHRVHIDRIWMNNLHEGAVHEKHAHGGAHYAGTFYVNCPPGASRIRFHNPIHQLWGLAMPPIGDTEVNSISAEWAEFDPIPGNLLVWNAWFYHEVLENKSTIEPRKTISFNAIII